VYKEVAAVKVADVPEDVVAVDPLATVVPFGPRELIETVLLASRFEGLVTWVMLAKAGRVLPATARTAAASVLFR